MFGYLSKGLQNIVKLDKILFSDIGFLDVELFETHELQIWFGTFLAALFIRIFIVTLDAFCECVLQVFSLHVD